MGNNDGRNANMNLAIAALQEKLAMLERDYVRDREELTRAITNLQLLPAGTPTKVKDGIAVEAGCWEGMCLTDSIHTLLLRSRKPVAFATIVKALGLAGVRMGDPEKPQRYNANVKTTIINNSSRFRYDKKRDTVRLVKPVGEQQYV